MRPLFSQVFAPLFVSFGLCIGANSGFVAIVLASSRLCEFTVIQNVHSDIRPFFQDELLSWRNPREKSTVTLIFTKANKSRGKGDNKQALLSHKFASHPKVSQVERSRRGHRFAKGSRCDFETLAHLPSCCNPSAD